MKAMIFGIVIGTGVGGCAGIVLGGPVLVSFAWAFLVSLPASFVGYWMATR